MAKWAIMILCIIGVTTEAIKSTKLRVYNIIRNPGIIFEKVNEVHLQEQSLQLISLINLNYIYNIHPYYQSKINSVPHLNQTIIDLKEWIGGLKELEGVDMGTSRWAVVVDNAGREGNLVNSRLNQEWISLSKEMYSADHSKNLT